MNLHDLPVSISRDQVQMLRSVTGSPVMKCKEALIASNGNQEKAIEYLRKQGESIGQQMNKPTEAGAIFAYTHHNGQVAAMIELKCQTDFVARNEEFKAMGQALAMQVASISSPWLKLEDLPFIKDVTQSVQYALNQLKAKTGENITIGRITRMELGE